MKKVKIKITKDWSGKDKRVRLSKGQEFEVSEDTAKQLCDVKKIAERKK